MFEWLYEFIMRAMAWFMSLFGYEMPLLQQHSAEDASKEQEQEQEVKEDQEQEQDVKEVQQEVQEEQKLEEKASE